MMYWYDHGGGWGFVLMMLNMLVFWALVVTGIVLLVRYLNRPHTTARIGEAERILAERFARGEINEEEFHRRRDALRHGQRPPA